MDIFTILVFFLMVNSSDVKVLQQDKSVELPKSVAKQQPKENLVIAVSGENILVQGRVVSTVSEFSEEGMFLGLKAELDYQAGKNQSQQNVRDGYPVTLVADKDTPYKLLKKIMVTCTAASYTKVSLAVSRKLEGKGDK